MLTKKTLMVAALVVGLCLAGLQQASARGWGRGGGNGPGGGCLCQGYGPGYQMLNDADKAKVDAFRADTLDMQRQIAMKRAEKMALMNSQTPDPAAISQVAGELFDLQTAMAEKAKVAGLPMMSGGQRQGGQGQGGQGRFGGQRGPGGSGRMSTPCYNQVGWK